MPDIEDYRELVGRKKKEKINGERWNLQFLAQAQVRQNNLTGNPDFDRFLSYIQATVESLQEKSKSYEAMLCDPMLVNHDRIMEIKIAKTGVDNMIGALVAVMELPRQIMEVGEQAKEKLKSLGDNQNI